MESDLSLLTRECKMWDKEREEFRRGDYTVFSKFLSYTWVGDQSDCSGNHSIVFWLGPFFKDTDQLTEK
jgi:hypothetical protein